MSETLAQLGPWFVGQAAVPAPRRAPLADRGRPMNWYLVYVARRAEAAIVSDLEDIGVITYRPMLTQWSHRRRNQCRDDWRVTRTKVRRSLFPGYLFVALDAFLPRYSAIAGEAGIEGVVGFVGDAQGPVRVRAAGVGELQAAEIAGAFDETATLSREQMAERSPFQAGARVRVMSGPFAEFLARVREAPYRDRIRVYLQMERGREVPAELAIADVQML